MNRKLKKHHPVFHKQLFFFPYTHIPAVCNLNEHDLQLLTGAYIKNKLALCRPVASK